MLKTADRIKELNLQEIRRGIARKQRRRRNALPKIPKILYPYGIERSYRKTMRTLVSDMRRLVNTELMPEMKRILDAAELARPTIDSIRADEYDYATELSRLLEIVRTSFAGVYTEEELIAIAAKIARAVADQNGRELGKVWASVFGADVFKTEPWLAIETRAFVTQNVALIKTIPSQYFGEIEQKVFAAARQGLSYKELQADIQRSYGKSRARAELIARDQIGKFNGQLNMLRQTQAGLTRYRWATVKDERVRTSHRAREGKIFSWDDPPKGGHPGEDFQCRCQAIPLTEDLWTFESESEAETGT